jgi:peptide/nickel transport system substrate-binding protein
MVLVLPETMVWGGSVTTETLTVAFANLGEQTFLPWNGTITRNPYMNPIYDFLTYSEPGTGNIIPGLATRWEMSSDGKTWTFWIRKGIQFQGGWGELTADDVVYTIRRASAPEIQYGTGSQLRGWLDKVEAPEPYKVICHLKTALADFHAASPANTQQLGIVCKKYVETVGDEKANSHPIGSGPYAFIEHKRGSYIKLQARDEKHWRVIPQFKNINFLLVPEESTRVAMLRTGECDLAPISYDSVDAIKASGLNIISVPKTWAPAIKMGGLVMTDPKRYKASNPWADKRVRQALNYAVDKEAIVRKIFHGEASPIGATQIIPEWYDIKPYPYDPTKAKQLLAEAGYPKGFDITLKTFPSTPGAELPIMGEVAAMYWTQIGLNVKIVPTDWNTVRSEWNSGKSLDYVWTHRGAAFPSSATGVSIEHIAKMAYAAFVTEKTETMVSNIMKELDLNRRSAMVREMGEYLRDEAWAVFIAFANEPYGASKRVGRWPTVPGNIVNMEHITRP